MLVGADAGTGELFGVRLSGARYCPVEIAKLRVA